MVSQYWHQFRNLLEADISIHLCARGYPCVYVSLVSLLSLALANAVWVGITDNTHVTFAIQDGGFET